MEVVGLTPDFWKGRRVFLTGVTGFKGSWLALWLRELGATVIGYSLPPPTTPSLFAHGRLAERLEWVEADVRDRARLRGELTKAAADVVFHLAAQPLVRASYEDPIETFETNVMGTVNTLDAARGAETVRAVVIITSDKCYENLEWHWPYRETDALGGYDPYSSSKACAEIVSRAYHRSFLGPRRVGVATARAGNVIGGGDWSRDRLVPDIIAAVSTGRRPNIRNPQSIRPWQHVLEPLWGYIQLAEHLTKAADRFSEGWNFGPDPSSVRPVRDIVTSICELWGGASGWDTTDVAQPHEARNLTLDASKARAELGWTPRLSLSETLSWTVDWYKSFLNGDDMVNRSLEQIRRYSNGCAS